MNSKRLNAEGAKRPDTVGALSSYRAERGFTMLEVLITTAILLVVMTIVLVSWFGYTQRTAVDVATREILNMLHEAQGNSVARINNSSWGVYVSNPVGTMNAPYAELFYGVSHTTGTVTRRAEFSNDVELSTPTDGASSEIVFMQRSGRAASTDGELWIAYQDQTSDNLKVARYIPGSTGTGCINGASGWNCEVLATGGMTTNIATQDINIGPSSEVWISFNRDQGSGDFSLWAAKYVGVSGNCDAVLQGSDAWECAQVHVPPGGQDILDNEIVVAPNGTVWIVYDLNNNVYVANRTGTGSESTYLGGSADWNCALLRNHEVSNVSIAIDNAGNPWVVHDGDVASDLTVLTYVGVSGNCVDNDEWDCELDIVQDGDAGGDITDPTIAFSSSDMAWVAFGVGTVNELHVARRTGTAMETSCGVTGSADWDCTTIDSTRTVDGRKNGLAFNPAGAPRISYRDGGATDDLWYAELGGGGAACDAAAWSCGRIEVTDLVAWGSDFVFDSLGTAQIIYRNKTGDDALRLARYTGSGSEASCGGGSLNWICEDIDNPGALVDVGADPRIAAGPVWRVHMYALADTNLRTKTITVSAFGGIIITDG